MSRVSKRNKMAADYHIKMWIYQRDNKRCRWCDERVDFRLSMIVCHGLSVSLYPDYDHIDNWFTGCQDCNSQAGKFSFPPNPIVPEVVSVPQLDDLITEVRKVVALVVPSQAEWQPPPEDIELMSQSVTVRVQDEYDLIKQFESEIPRYHR
jgi:hypothetical protein